MNKKVFAFTVLLFSAAMLFCSEDFHFSFTPKFSTTIGQLGEHLFVKDQTVENNQTSLLEWNETSAPTIGGEVELLAASHFYIGIAFTAGIPMYVGQMYDYDWFMNTNICQSRSISPEKLTELYYTDFDFGYKIDLTSSLSLIPLVGVSYKYINFFADVSNGYTDPEPYDADIISFDDKNAEKFEATWITYWRATTLLWIGTDVQFSLNKFISFDCMLKIAPYISAKSEDNHPGSRYKEDTDEPIGKFLQDFPTGYFKAFNLMLSSQIRLSKMLSLNLKLEGFYLGLITGPTYTSSKPGILGNLENSDYIGDTQKDLTFSLGFKINLF